MTVTIDNANNEFLEQCRTGEEGNVFQHCHMLVTKFIIADRRIRWLGMTRAVRNKKEKRIENLHENSFQVLAAVLK